MCWSWINIVQNTFFSCHVPPLAPHAGYRAFSLVRTALSWVILGHDKPFIALWINQQNFSWFGSKVIGADGCNRHWVWFQRSSLFLLSDLLPLPHGYKCNLALPSASCPLSLPQRFFLLSCIILKRCDSTPICMWTKIGTVENERMTAGVRRKEWSMRRGSQRQCQQWWVLEEK